MRLLNIAAFCFAVTCALMLYSLNYETGRLEAQVQAQERVAKQARSDIAVLKAERSHLSRPERIDPLARRQGLVQPAPHQFTTADALPALFGMAAATPPQAKAGD